MAFIRHGQTHAQETTNYIGVRLLNLSPEVLELISLFLNHRAPFMLQSFARVPQGIPPNPLE